MQEDSEVEFDGVTARSKDSVGAVFEQLNHARPRVTVPETIAANSG